MTPASKNAPQKNLTALIDRSCPPIPLKKGFFFRQNTCPEKIGCITGPVVHGKKILVNNIFVAVIFIPLSLFNNAHLINVNKIS